MNELRARLTTEAADVDRLESFSPTRIWAALTGSRAGDLDRERAEHDAARYAVAGAEARRDAAGRDAEALQAQLDALGDVDVVHARALAAKEAWAAEHDPALASSLAGIAHERGVLEARDKEAAEAHAAGREVLGLLDEARRHLGSAESWSTWDTFAGGGMLSDMAKYDKMDRATELLRRADLALGRFSRELADVGMTAVGGVQVDTMTRTFDMFFDNIFTDMAVRSRIQDAARRAAGADQAVRQALGRLEQTGRDIGARLTALDERREQLLTTGR
ncbi:MAG TPA: hypothetical protein VFG63_02310 [Nocardioidaceae bacterium]|nr:hypothetical protein [Nocardioidaceae bacterium]